MSLRSALLALLSSGPLTGYDVAKQFSSSVGHVWHAPDSQIYPELRKMHAEGLLSSRPVPWGTRGATKTEYTLTPAGEEALRQWQSQPLAYVQERDPARLKAAYFEWAPSGAAAAQLRTHIAHYEEQRLQTLDMIDALEQRAHPTLARRLTRYVEEEREQIVRFKIYAYEGQLAHAEQEIAWAKRGLQILEELENARKHDRAKPDIHSP
ncbi:PadR family transcriptional regulator [Arthrobacter burdickii]|uniref:PadR family transcriptional regulator n=1 Tax=Arthrobacter burdickii TaxID=3035920 RepID=A0ABT8JY72_9MICC|nr:PadR family transcriptional regulator [Arthrobacter burdickii]MDN4609526.1 PadR family transcriptional regulator [Arthrobacter burdickii]